MTGHAVHRVRRVRLLGADGGALVWPLDSADVAAVA